MFLNSLSAVLMVFGAVFLLSTHCFLLVYFMFPSLNLVSAILLEDVVLWHSPGTEDLCFLSLQLDYMGVPQGHICNAEIKVLSLCLKSCIVGLGYPMSMFYSSHGDEAWVVKSVAAKWNSFGTRLLSSASIEGHALVSQHWISVMFQSELSVRPGVVL